MCVCQRSVRLRIAFARAWDFADIFWMQHELDCELELFMHPKCVRKVPGTRERGPEARRARALRKRQTLTGLEGGRVEGT